jgi:hypothetical protein
LPRCSTITRTLGIDTAYSLRQLNHRQVSECDALHRAHTRSEILTLGQLFRDRADCENTFDELKNQWGWGGFTTHDLKRCRLLARSVALIYNWWSLFVRLADPEHHREAITSRPLLLSALARRTHHVGQVTLTVSSAHGEQHLARRAYLRIAGFMARLRQSAEQLDALGRWYRILSEALRHYLNGRQLEPPFDSTPPEPQSPVVPSHINSGQPQPTAGFRIEPLLAAARPLHPARAGRATQNRSTHTIKLSELQCTASSMSSGLPLDDPHSFCRASPRSA